MLTLTKESTCDVCANDYNPFNPPRCIPCGHVLCGNCASNIINLASKKAPACPFCREQFTLDSLRVIRADFSQTSGGGTSESSQHHQHGNIHSINDIPSSPFVQSCLPPLAMDPLSSSAILDDETVLYEVRRTRSAVTSARSSRAASRERGGVFKALDEDKPTSLDTVRHHERAIELEKSVAKVATKRCSAEEVQALQKQLADWMSEDKSLYSGGDVQRYTAIQLSNLLLRAILMNHVAHSEAARVAKGTEQSLRSRLQDGDLIRMNLSEELRSAKTEVGNLKLTVKELQSRLKAVDSGSATPGAVTPTRRQSLSAPTSPDGSHYTSFSSASTAVPFHYPSSNTYSSSSRDRDNKKESFSNPTSLASSPCSSGRTTPTAGLTLSAPTAFGMAPTTGSVSGTTTPGRSSASAAAAALPLHPSTHPTHVHSQPATPSPTPVRYSHTRAASMVSRAQSVAPTREKEREREKEKRSMIPAPSIHHRSASVVPGAVGPSGTVRGGGMMGRSMTPGPTSSASQASAYNTSSKEGNGYSAGGLGAGASGGIPPLPNLVHISSLSSSQGNSRPPVPPKPRTLSQNQTPGQGQSHGSSPMKLGSVYSSSSGSRGIIDDRDVDREKEKKSSKKYERWVPSARTLVGMVRPATSQS